MNAKEAIEKAREFFGQLDPFIKLGNNYDKVSSAKGFKSFIELVNQNGETMKSVFTEMKICLKNEARFFLNELNKKDISGGEKDLLKRKIKKIESLVGILTAKIKVLGISKKNFSVQSEYIDSYLLHLESAERNDQFSKAIKAEIIGNLNVLSLSNYIYDFEDIISQSNFQKLEEEIVTDKRYIKGYNKSKYPWL